MTNEEKIKKYEDYFKYYKFALHIEPQGKQWYFQFNGLTVADFNHSPFWLLQSYLNPTEEELNHLKGLVFKHFHKFERSNLEKIIEYKENKNFHPCI